MTLNRRIIEVMNREGSPNKKTAELMLCPDCDGAAFLLYEIHHPDCGCPKNSLHLQCCQCDMTYCQREGGEES